MLENKISSKPGPFISHCDKMPKLFKNVSGSKAKVPNECVRVKTKKKRKKESNVQDTEPEKTADILGEFGITMDTVNELKSCLLSEEWSDGDDDDSDNNADEVESSDEEDMDQDEDEDEDPDEEFRERVRLALGPAGISDPDGSGPEVDDEEMFQLDRALGEAFKSKFGANKEEELYEKEQRVVRLKTINLIRRFFRAKEATSVMILHLICALLDAYKMYTAQNERKIRVRVMKTLSLLQSVRYYKNSSTLESELVERTFKKAVDLSWRIEEKSLQLACARVCRWSISLSHFVSLEQDWIQKEIKKLTQDFFTKPNCCLSKQFMLLLLHHEKVMNSWVVEILLSHIFSEIRAFKRLSGISLMYFCIKGLSTVTDEIKESLMTHQADMIRGLLDAVSKAKGPFINEWLQLLFIISKHVPLDIHQDHVKMVQELPKKLIKKFYKPSKLFLRSILDSTQTNLPRTTKRKKELKILFKNRNQESSPAEQPSQASRAYPQQKPKLLSDNHNVVRSKPSSDQAPLKGVKAHEPIIHDSVLHPKKPKSPRKKLIIERLPPSSPEKVSQAYAVVAQPSERPRSSPEKIENELSLGKEALKTDQPEGDTNMSLASNPKKSISSPKKPILINSIEKIVPELLPDKPNTGKNAQECLENDTTGSYETTASSQESEEFTPIPIPRVLITPKKGFDG